MAVVVKMDLNEFVTFNWEFNFSVYATPEEQSKLIKEQYIFPLIQLSLPASKKPMQFNFKLTYGQRYTAYMKKTFNLETGIHDKLQDEISLESCKVNNEKIFVRFH